MKFKITNKKNKKEPAKKEFPRNFRFFTEKIGDEAIFFIGLSAILAAGLLVGLNLYSNLASQKKMIAQTRQLQTQLNFWENEIKARPNYRDAYFSLALIYYQLGNFDFAKQNLEKALTIDPNFEKGRELEQLLNSKY